jgi:NADH-quinone oxidoreductase subunit J
MTLIFLILAAITIVGTAAAMSFRNPIHCILGLTVGLVGLASLYLLLGAQFVGFTQIIVYVGAVAILAVFAIMMTQGGRRQSEAETKPEITPTLLAGVAVAGAVFAVLAWAILAHPVGAAGQSSQPVVSVNQIGELLMHKYVLPLEIMAVLLTAALIGAVIIAMPHEQEKP